MSPAKGIGGGNSGGRPNPGGGGNWQARPSGQIRYTPGRADPYQGPGGVNSPDYGQYPGQYPAAPGKVGGGKGRGLIFTVVGLLGCLAIDIGVGLCGILGTRSQEVTGKIPHLPGLDRSTDPEQFQKLLEVQRFLNDGHIAEPTRSPEKSKSLVETTRGITQIEPTSLTSTRNTTFVIE